MCKIVLFIATTIDGKIARLDGGLDWLDALPNPNQIDHGYHDFLGTVGATIMGKKTYQKVISFGIEWPYKGINSYVATSDKDFEISTPDTFLIQDDLAKFASELKKSSEKDIWLIGGGELITYFITHDLLDSMILNVIPIIMGNGIPLFPQTPKETNWTLSKVESFETGIVNLTYDKI